VTSQVGSPAWMPASIRSIWRSVGAGAQRVADPIQRVVFAAVVTELFLLDAAAGLLHRLESEPHHVKGVQDGGGVLEFLADRVGVAPEGIQRRHPHLGGEPRAAAGQPVGVGLAGAARRQLQQPSPRSTIVPGQIHHAGQLLRCLTSLGVWCHRCSSTSRTCTSASRAGSSANSASTGRIASQTVCQSTPSRRATEALSHWMQLIVGVRPHVSVGVRPHVSVSAG
jgi:hypothetical protein